MKVVGKMPRSVFSGRPTVIEFLKTKGLSSLPDHLLSSPKTFATVATVGSRAAMSAEC